MLRCDRCAEQTWVRAVPAEFAGVLPNIVHLVGEDPDPLAAAPLAAEAATFPCPQCGSPVPLDGVTRTYVCRFCSASVHVPDDFIYRGRRKLAVNWFLCFHPSVVDQAPVGQAVSAGLFDWDSPPDAAVDAHGNLYCAARQSHWVPDHHGTRQRFDDVVWSIDPSLNLRWLQRGGSRAVRLVLSPKGVLLVTQRGRANRHWLSSATGRPVEGSGGIVQKNDGELLDCDDLTCDRDGSLLILKDSMLRRIAPNGVELDVWLDGTPGTGDDDARSCTGEILGVAVDMSAVGMRVHRGPDGSIFFMGSREIARFDASGREIFAVALLCSEMNSLYRNLGADLHGNAYVLCSDRLLRVSPEGAQSVVLTKKRDKLPRSEMSLAVCPDGSFWLFGTKGAAWKFGADGALLFASDKEPRPRKWTMAEVSQWAFQRRLQKSMAESIARMQESDQVQEDREAAERRRKGIVVLIILGIGLGVLFGLTELLSAMRRVPPP
ncbi:hypothetical protein [Sorangium sp. So ce406]|uniref:hypothetical protein n=1 Tax=Sorangium sp. So ce406 TaxID=3133311 RepID=UPI003F5B60A0